MNYMTNIQTKLLIKFFFFLHSRRCIKKEGVE